MATDAHDTSYQTQDPTQMSRKRRQSNAPQDMAGPVIRRMSRLEPRPSVQYGSSRRMSYASRSSVGNARSSVCHHRSSTYNPRSSVCHHRSSTYNPRLSVFQRLSVHNPRSSISGHSWGMGPMKQMVKLANTYRLAPRPEEKFNSATARKLMTGVLQSYLEGERYDKTLSISLSKNLADVIKERMKDQGFSQRYKYVCVVTMGEKKDQGMAVCSRCVWNTDTDNYASASYTKGDLFAVATLYALYFE